MCCVNCVETFLLIVLSLFVATTQENEGIHKDSDPWFNCGGTTNIKIPQQYFDDNYCDCLETGKDEPHTSACNNGRFWCTPDHKYIPSSLVNDGICDCSDGSDESLTNGKCDKYNHKIQHIQRDFDLLAQTINNIHHIYQNILFPNYIISMFTTQEMDPNNYRNMKDVQKFLRQKRSKRQTKTRQSNMKRVEHNKRLKNEESFAENDKSSVADSSYSVFGGLFMFVTALVASLVSIVYYVRLKYFDKSKQN